jgi:exodeoxyribonuclease-3
MKCCTWNVNGLRACIDKFFDYITDTEADIYAIQETKVNASIPDLEGLGYGVEWNIGERLGYSGTAIFYKEKPLSVKYGLGNKTLDKEGRRITLEYPDYYFVNVYVPNSQGGLERWYSRLDWDSAFRDYTENLRNNKNVIICGDFNVAHSYIDVFPENLRNEENPHGFRSEERDGLDALLDLGLVDVYRKFYPDRERAYTWWSNRLHKRKENRGWRLDYFLVSEDLIPHVQSCEIRADIYGSDHAPVELEVKI